MIQRKTIGNKTLTIHWDFVVVDHVHIRWFPRLLPPPIFHTILWYGHTPIFHDILWYGHTPIFHDILWLGNTPIFKSVLWGVAANVYFERVSLRMPWTYHPKDVIELTAHERTLGGPPGDDYEMRERIFIKNDIKTQMRKQKISSADVQNIAKELGINKKSNEMTSGELNRILLEIKK